MSALPEQSAYAPASVVVHLYADRFMPAAAAGKGGPIALSSGVVVVREVLASLMVAAGLWSLREQGAVALEVFHEKKMFGTKSGVRVRLVQELPTSGLEAQLMQSLARNKKARQDGVGVRDLVHAVVPRSPVPYSEVVGVAILQECDEGYVLKEMRPGAPDKRGRPGKPKPHITPVPDRIATLAPLAEHLVAQWAQFAAAEAELKEMLVAESRAGISASTHTETEFDADE